MKWSSQFKLFSWSGDGGARVVAYVLQRKAIGGATVSGEKKGWLNAAGPKSWNSISASSDYRYQCGRWIFLLIYMHKFRCNHPVNQRTHLLQASWWRISSDLTNKKVKRKTDLWSDNGCTGLKRHLFSYWKLYFNDPTYNGPTYNSPIYESRAECSAHGAY